MWVNARNLYVNNRIAGAAPNPHQNAARNSPQNASRNPSQNASPNSK